MASLQSTESSQKKRVLLSDAMLYLFAKEAEKRGSFKLRMTDIYRTMSHFQSDFKDLGIPVTFEQTGTDIYSRRLDEAMYYLIPFDVQIVNPSFSIVLESDQASRRLKKLDSRLSGEAKEKLDSMFEKFDANLPS